MLGKLGRNIHNGLRIPLARMSVSASLSDSFPTEPTALEVLSFFDSQELIDDIKFITSAQGHLTVARRLGVIRTDAKVTEAAILMEKISQRPIGDPCTALIVKDDDEIKGIISERDLTKNIAKSKGNVSKLKVGEVMTSADKWKGTWVTPRTSLKVCKDIINKFRIRHLPVFGELSDDGREMDTLFDELVPKRGSVFHGIVTLNQIIHSSSSYQLMVDAYVER